MKSPLFIGTDLTTWVGAALCTSVARNTEAIAVNQDPLGVQVCACGSGGGGGSGSGVGCGTMHDSPVGDRCWTRPLGLRLVRSAARFSA